MQPTMKLRWLARPVPMPHLGERVGQMQKFLQQLWIGENPIDGELLHEWRDIEIAEE